MQVIQYLRMYIYMYYVCMYKIVEFKKKKEKAFYWNEYEDI